MSAKHVYTVRYHELPEGRTLLGGKPRIVRVKASCKKAAVDRAKARVGLGNEFRLSSVELTEEGDKLRHYRKREGKPPTR